MEKICGNCRYDAEGEKNYPCNECIRGSKWESVLNDSVNHPSKDIYCEGKKQIFHHGILMDVPNDSVNHPSHYNKGKIEVADFIADQKLNFDRGNAVKYVCRAGSKDPDKEIQDLEKAIWYINHEIKMLKGECEDA